MTARFGLPQHAVEKICKIFEEYPGIESVLVYGSRARGNYRSNSDIDLSIKGPDIDLETLFQIENQIDDLLLPWSVDLSLFHKTDNPDLIDHISQVGVEFCERLRCR